MNIRAISILSAALIAVCATSVSAQTGGSGSAYGEVQSGGLGGGISTMVRNILIETEHAPEAPQAQVMMFSTVEADSSATGPAPEPMSASDIRAEDGASMKSARVMTANTATVSEEDLAAYVRTVVSSDEKIRSIDVADGHVRIFYNVKGKFLGLFSLPVIVRAEVYASGDATISVPWFARVPGISAAAQADFQSRVSPFIPSDDAFTPDERMQIVGLIHAFLIETYATGTK